MSKRIEFNTSNKGDKIIKVKGYFIYIDKVKFGLHYGQTNPGEWSVTELSTGATAGRFADKSIAIDLATSNMRLKRTQQYIQNFKDKHPKIKFPVNEPT